MVAEMFPLKASGKPSEGPIGQPLTYNIITLPWNVSTKALHRQSDLGEFFTSWMPSTFLPRRTPLQLSITDSRLGMPVLRKSSILR